jgi:hypothetical protein
MGYVIQTVTLSSARATTNGPVALVESKEDLTEFLNDLRNLKRGQRYLLLGYELSGLYEEHMKHDGLIGNLGGLGGAVAMGSGIGMLLGLGKILVSGPGRIFSSDPFKRLDATWAGLKGIPFKYNCGRIGVGL